MASGSGDLPLEEDDVIEDVIFSGNLTNITNITFIVTKPRNFMMESGFWVWYVAYFIPIIVCLGIVMVAIHAPKKIILTRDVSSMECYRDEEEDDDDEGERSDKNLCVYRTSTTGTTNRVNEATGSVPVPHGRLSNITPNSQGLYAFPLLSRDPASPSTSDREEQHNSYWLTGY